MERIAWYRAARLRSMLVKSCPAFAEPTQTDAGLMTPMLRPDPA